MSQWPRTASKCMFWLILYMLKNLMELRYIISNVCSWCWQEKFALAWSALSSSVFFQILQNCSILSRWMAYAHTKRSQRKPFGKCSKFRVFWVKLWVRLSGIVIELQTKIKHHLAKRNGAPEHIDLAALLKRFPKASSVTGTAHYFLEWWK